MPIYCYRCDSCSAQLEVLEPVTAPTARPCPCGQTAQRILKASSFILIGGGWEADAYQK